MEFLIKMSYFIFRYTVKIARKYTQYIHNFSEIPWEYGAYNGVCPMGAPLIVR